MKFTYIFHLYFSLIFFTYILSDCTLLFPFEDYLIDKEELSTSCKENENPEGSLETAPENIPASRPKLSDNNKNAKIAKPQDDAFEDDDDVFQQYLTENMDNASTSAQNPQQGNLNVPITGIL